jgi:RES domain-containing protein
VSSQNSLACTEVASFVRGRCFIEHEFIPLAAPRIFHLIHFLVKRWQPRLPAKTKGGRLNPEGIPYLYVATDEATAIAEVRPWQRAAVSVASLRLVRDVSVVDFCRPTADPSPGIEQEDWEKGQGFTWDMVGDGFSIPHHHEDRLRYLPTQYLAEAFKAVSFDGIRYDSSLSPSGQNIALYDCAVAGVESVRRAKVTGIRYEYEWRTA